jgi:hypothetical protein
MKKGVITLTILLALIVVGGVFSFSQGMQGVFQVFSVFSADIELIEA